MKINISINSEKDELFGYIKTETNTQLKKISI